MKHSTVSIMYCSLYFTLDLRAPVSNQTFLSATGHNTPPYIQNTTVYTGHETRKLYLCQKTHNRHFSLEAISSVGFILNTMENSKLKMEHLEKDRSSWCTKMTYTLAQANTELHHESNSAFIFQQMWKKNLRCRLVNSDNNSHFHKSLSRMMG